MSAKLTDLCNRIIEEFREDETSIDITHVTVNPEKKGILAGGKKKVVLTGRVENEVDREKLQKIAEEIAGTVPVENSLHVKSSN